MRKHYTGLLLAGLLSISAAAQYCSPDFAFGCFTWTNQSIDLGSIHWTLASANNDCTLSDFTAQSTTITSGTSANMTVANGNWCGCGVWIDLDNDGTFQDGENFFYNYAGDETHTYSFPIDIPQGTPAGAYRIRVVAGWGTDCYNESGNGYGPCGTYQYGSFQDFTVNVVNSTAGIDDLAATEQVIAATPNPTSGDVVLTMAATAGWERIIVRDLGGRIVRQQPVTARAEKLQLDLQGLPAGVYTVQGLSEKGTRSLRIVRQ